VARIKLGTWIVAAAPIEENAVDRLRLGCQCPDKSASNLSIIVAAFDSKAVEQGFDERPVETIAPIAEKFRQLGCLGE